jgi:hypothetical protein
VVNDGDADSMLQFQLEERRPDEVLSEDETEATSSSWLHEKEM